MADGELALTLALLEQQHLDTLAQMALRASTTTRWKSPSGRVDISCREWWECWLWLLLMRSCSSLYGLAAWHGRWVTEEARIRVKLDAGKAL